MQLLKISEFSKSEKEEIVPFISACGSASLQAEYAYTHEAEAQTAWRPGHQWQSTGKKQRSPGLSAPLSSKSWRRLCKEAECKVL